MPDWLQAVVAIGASTLRIATPLILCAMGGLFSERGGVVDIGLEGKMLIAAFAAAAAATATGSAPIGLAAGCAAALVFSVVHGFASINHAGNQIVSGVALNMLASGLTIVLGQAWFGQGGATPALPPSARFMPVAGGLNILTYGALLTVPLAFWVVGSTRFGLRLRAVGEAPRAVDSAGISVALLRYRGVLICGLLAGIAGANLSLGQSAGFSREMTAGQGYIALAALIFGKWRAFPAFGACLLFGLLDAVAVRLQGVRIAGFGEIPVQLFQTLPYALTVVLLAGFAGRALAPKAIGAPYVKE